MGFTINQIDQLQSLGYTISSDETSIYINRKTRIPFTILLISSLIVCLLIIFFTNGNGVEMFSILLPIAVLIFYRRNVATMILLDKRRGYIEYTLGLFMPKFSRNLSAIKSIKLNTYDYTGTVSPFKEGNRDYYADVKILWNDGKELEVFHFTDRSAENLQFAREYQELLQAYITSPV